MIYTVIKSVVSTSPTDIVAGAIGMIDEIFLGFLMADAFISVGTMGREYFEELLHNVSAGRG